MPDLSIDSTLENILIRSGLQFLALAWQICPQIAKEKYIFSDKQNRSNLKDCTPNSLEE